MDRRSRRSFVLAAAVALTSTLFVGPPAAASCIPLADLLPDAASETSAVFIGTVLATGDVETEMAVDSWYFGASPVSEVVVVGGRDPQAITSVDWAPVPGEHYVVVAEPVGESLWITGTCQQSEPFPELLATLEARYGEPQPPPYPPAGDVASPGPSPAPSAGSPEPASAVESPPVVTSNDSPLPGSLVHGTPEP
jgi:hypothetical protein